MSKAGIMICGHGSRSQGAVEQFNAMAQRVRDARPDIPVESGFLEFATPIINDGLTKLKDQGVDHIYAIPGMLFAAGHAKNDIPTVLNTFAAKHGIKVSYGRELGIDNKMIRAAGDRIHQAMSEADAENGVVDKHDTLLVVVGRGASDPDANGNVAKVTRMLWEGLGFGHAMTVYSGVTFPLVEPGLDMAHKLGFKRILVFPYFLFTGILIDRIYDTVDLVADRHSGTQFVKAGFFNDHPLLIEAFLDRVSEIDAGTNVMNCLNCKYRDQVLGFEEEVGAVQESHHHHVEGIGTGDAPDNPSHDHNHSHDHSHGHDHDHHHHPYPHNDHPMGPRSLPGKREGDRVICPCGRWAAKAAE